jgi:hypothetical protein
MEPFTCDQCQAEPPAVNPTRIGDGAVTVR